MGGIRALFGNGQVSAYVYAAARRAASPDRKLLNNKGKFLALSLR
jgi:hypothetical protein